MKKFKTMHQNVQYFGYLFKRFWTSCQRLFKDENLESMLEKRGPAYLK